MGFNFNKNIFLIKFYNLNVTDEDKTKVHSLDSISLANDQSYPIILTSSFMNNFKSIQVAGDQSALDEQAQHQDQMMKFRMTVRLYI